MVNKSLGVGGSGLLECNTGHSKSVWGKPQNASSRLTGKDLEGDSRGLFQGTFPEFTW